MVVSCTRRGKRPRDDSPGAPHAEKFISSTVRRYSEDPGAGLPEVSLDIFPFGDSGLSVTESLRLGDSYQASTSPSIFEMQLPSNVSSSRLTQDSKPSILERLLLLNDAHFKFSNFSRFVISKRCCPSKFKAVIYTIIHITCYFWILQTSSKLLD